MWQQVLLGDTAHAVSQNGWTPLLHNVRALHGDGKGLALVEYLVEQGADVNVQNKVSHRES